MTLGRSRRITLAALLVPLSMIVGLRSAWALYACRVDGVVRTSCCCAGKHKRAAQEPTPAPVVRSAGCCDVTIQAPSAAPQARDTDRTDGIKAPPPMVVALEPAPSPAIARVVSIDPRLARPPPVATFLKKQAFLR